MKKAIGGIIALGCAAALFVSCGKSGSKDVSKATDYKFGEEVTFYSNEPVTYSMFFSDASWYPMVETWKTEGVFKKIMDKTNVNLDLTTFDSGDYNQKVNLAINSGASAYIIPKIYSEDQYVAGGGIVAVSDYTKYMPNFTAFVKKYNMDSDLDTIKQSDGRFYRLPGMHQAPLQDYTLLVREDIFEAAGYNIRELEKNWTWEDLHDVLLGVKKYMVSKGMCKESDYIWSDLWCGESGKGGGNLLKLMGASYNVLSGWGIEGSNGGIKYDWNKKEFYSSSISDDFKKLVTVANSYVKDGILDPETFTQSDEIAHNKFYNGKTVIMSTNRGVLSNDISGVNKILGEGNSKVYITAYPTGTNKNLAETSRLECGVMIAQKALDELGEENFIKMMRFVDWLFYSKEAYSLIKWGPEGETWHYVDADGLQIKALLPGYKCGGLGISGAESDVDIRLKWGYACGNYYYGHATEDSTDNFTPLLQDLMKRYVTYRTSAKVDPKAKPTEDQREQITLWAVPLVDNINAWTLKFITGQKDINKDWNEYINSCKNLNVDKIVDLTNKIYSEQ
jgi:putative aldouronate transport system substrate-binding protein